MKEVRIQIAVVSDRPWNSGMAANLNRRTTYDVQMISDPRDLTVDRLSSISPRFVFFPHWSHRIEADIYEQFECVIFHMTDLPFGRGGSPLQNLITRHIYDTQISAFRCVQTMDAGPIYLKRPLSLHGSAEEIFLRASYVMEDMIIEMVERNPEPKVQEGEPTLFKRRRPEDGNLAAVDSLEQTFDIIRMLDASGYPNAFLKIGPLKFEFSRASRKADQVMADVRISIEENLKGINKQ